MQRSGYRPNSGKAERNVFEREPAERIRARTADLRRIESRNVLADMLKAMAAVARER